MAASVAASVVCLTDIIWWSVLGTSLGSTAVFLATTFGSGFRFVTTAFFKGALGVTAGLAIAVIAVFAPVLLGTAAAFTGFLDAGLAGSLPAFETAFGAALFAVFFTAASLDLAADFAAGFAEDFAAGLVAGLATLRATFFAADFADFTGLLATAVDVLFFAGCAAFDLVAEVFTDFLFVAMGLSTSGNCRYCNGNWSAVGADYFSRLAGRSHFCADRFCTIGGRGSSRVKNSYQRRLKNKRTSVKKLSIIPERGFDPAHQVP